MNIIYCLLFITCMVLVDTWKLLLTWLYSGVDIIGFRERVFEWTTASVGIFRGFGQGQAPLGNFEILALINFQYSEGQSVLIAADLSQLCIKKIGSAKRWTIISMCMRVYIFQTIFAWLYWMTRALFCFTLFFYYFFIIFFFTRLCGNCKFLDMN